MRKGSHMSEESKKKISISMIEVRKTINPMKGRTGEKHHNFGKHWDEETRQRMSDSHKGQESSFKGKTHTKESNRKNSEAHKGRIPWNKGLKTGPHTKEHNLHIAEGISDHPVGRGCWFDRKDGTKVWLRSSYEVRIANILDKLPISWEYEPEKFVMDNRVYIPDFLINNYIYWEIKGYMDDISIEKLHQFNDYYPNEYIKVIYLSDIEKLEDLLQNDLEIKLNEIGITIDQI